MADWADERAREIANVTDVECGEYKHLVIAITKALKESYEEGVNDLNQLPSIEYYRKGLERGAVIAEHSGCSVCGELIAEAIRKEIT